MNENTGIANVTPLSGFDIAPLAPGGNEVVQALLEDISKLGPNRYSEN